MYGGIVLGVLALLARVAQGAPSSLRQDTSFVTKRQDDIPSYLQQDYYEEKTWPTTSSPVSMTFYISKQVVQPDGLSRDAVVVTTKDPEAADFTAADITIPGPKIEADFGAEITIKVVNRLKEMGTSIHFHGVRQYHSNHMDGAPSITQCPIAPGQSYTYRWRATQYGTSWYHSHVGVQAWDGLFGPIVIKHPEDREAKYDLGPIVLSDWMHQPIESVVKEITLGHVGSSMDNVLINGQNVLPEDETKGQRHQLVFHPKETHRLRLINAAVDSTFRFSIDNHEMKVIAADFVPIKPYTTKTLTLTMGQRYDVVVTANQEAKDYWLRAVPLNSCRSSQHPNSQKDNYATSIVRYDENSTKPPTTKPWPIAEEDDQCIDEPASKLKSALEKSVPKELAEKTNPGTLIEWHLGADPDFPEDFKSQYSLSVNGKGTDLPFFQDWRYPTLESYMSGNKSNVQTTHTVDLAAGEWMKIVIANDMGTVHPIHLHGHDFYILAQTTYPDGEPKPDPKDLELNIVDPPRRDVAMLGPNGYLVLAIVADNPGAWLMHCHVGYHAVQGMNLQIAEAMDQAAGFVNDDQLGSTCMGWKKFWDGPDGYGNKHNVTQKQMFEPGP